jgi:DNA-binding transcriptional regulator YiaG
LHARSSESERLATLPPKALSVRVARLAALVTQQDLADRLGCTVQYICHSESVRSHLSEAQRDAMLAAIREIAEERSRG